MMYEQEFLISLYHGSTNNLIRWCYFDSCKITVKQNSRMFQTTDGTDCSFECLGTHFSVLHSTYLETYKTDLLLYISNRALK